MLEAAPLTTTGNLFCSLFAWAMLERSSLTYVCYFHFKLAEAISFICKQVLIFMQKEICFCARFLAPFTCIFHAKSTIYVFLSLQTGFNCAICRSSFSSEIMKDSFSTILRNLPPNGRLFALR